MDVVLLQERSVADSPLVCCLLLPKPHDYSQERIWPFQLDIHALYNQNQLRIATMSSQDTYFPAQGWIDRIVPFSEAQHDKYKLTEKLSEKVSLCTEEEWAEYRYRSQAWATFVCVNEATNNEAIMKIWMQ